MTFKLKNKIITMRTFNKLQKLSEHFRKQGVNTKYKSMKHAYLKNAGHIYFYNGKIYTSLLPWLELEMVNAFPNDFQKNQNGQVVFKHKPTATLSFLLPIYFELSPAEFALCFTAFTTRKGFEANLRSGRIKPSYHAERIDDFFEVQYILNECEKTIYMRESMIEKQNKDILIKEFEANQKNNLLSTRLKNYQNN